MSEWTAGFNLPSKQNSSSGTYLSEKSIGHLGFTGTSLWIDPIKQLAVVFLTNRVIKGEDQSGIKELRPFIHDYIIKGMNM
jgi:CubicO group peptidase (beta-lactamase class C family)